MLGESWRSTPASVVHNLTDTDVTVTLIISEAGGRSTPPQPCDRGRDGRGQHPHAGAQWGQSGLEAALLLGEAPAGRLREPRLLPRPRPGDEGGLGQHIRQAAGGLH